MFKKDSTSIRRDFLVIKQLPCIITHQKIIANQL